MGVDRTIEIRLVTNSKCFSEILRVLVESGFAFNADGTISTLSEEDVDDFNYMQYNSIDSVNEILNKREERGLNNYIVMRDRSIDDSLLISSRKVSCKYQGYENQYELLFSIGHGLRIKGADRYTDFSAYLHKLLPAFIKNSMYVCEVKCNDYDC